MEDFTIDLQLFAEGEAATESSPATSAESPAPQEAAPEPAPEPEFALRKNPDTGRMEFLEGNEINPQQEAPQQPPQPNAYTADELVKDFAMGRVNEGRIPQELAGYYTAIKTQQENAQLRQQAAMQQQMVMQQQAQAQPQQPQVNNEARMVEAYQKMEQYARDKAFKDLGINGDEGLLELQYSDNPNDKQKAAVFNIAVQQNMQILGRAVADEQARMAAEEQATQNEAGIIKNGVAEYMKTEPHWNEIDQLMMNYWKTMPFEKAGPVVQTLERVENVFRGKPGAKLLPQDKDVLNQYYQECKKAFYSKQTGVGTTPQPASKPQVPNVEHTGQASTTPPAKVDWRAMRTMSPRDRREFFMSNIG